MKLKKKHFEIAKTISWFVDRHYYPDFIEPTREQINIFTMVESQGSSQLTPEQMKLGEPMFNGKSNYDLQIKMIHSELKDWVEMGWGWYYPIDSMFSRVWKERHQCKIYIKMLINLIKKLKRDGSYITLMNYTGFSDSEKSNLTNRYFSN